MHSKPLTIDVGTGQVSALLGTHPLHRVPYVLAHGAGAGMTHPFMGAIAAGLAARGIATLRYQFLYMERGSKRPDVPAVAQAAVRAAVGEAGRLAPALPLVAGGKSFGGRMTSQAQAVSPLPGVVGSRSSDFPLTPGTDRPSDARAAHLFDVRVPMLFLQGTRDALADLSLLEPLVTRLGAVATLKRFADADHSFHVSARSGHTDEQVRHELLDVLGRVDRWGDCWQIAAEGTAFNDERHERNEIREAEHVKRKRSISCISIVSWLSWLWLLWFPEPCTRTEKRERSSANGGFYFVQPMS